MKTLVALALLGTLAATAAAPLPIIPQPVAVQPGEGAFAFSATTAIRHDRKLAAEAKLFADDLSKLTGTPTTTVTKELRIFLESEILLELDPAADLPPSGYRLAMCGHQACQVGYHLGAQGLGF